MEPRIQYAKTSDGVNVALWTMGQGPPIVHMPSGPSSVSQALWQRASIRQAFERHAQKRMLVRYDSRGFGHSDRDVHQLSLEAWLLDLEGVVDHLGLERFVLYGMGDATPIAIAYAARHPERVTHLILLNASARGRDFVNVERRLALLALADVDWEFYTEAVAQEAFGWAGGEEARAAAAANREGQTPGALRAVMETMLEIDVSGLLPQVLCPTLVCHIRSLRFPEINVARRLVGMIADAQLAVLEGGHPYLEGQGDPFFRAIDDFLGEREPGDEAFRRPGSLVTILFTDLVSSTALTQRLGDAKAQELVRAHNSIVREALAAQGGSEIKHTGDGIMASFPTASGALECAVRYNGRWKGRGSGVEGRKS